MVKDFSKFEQGKSQPENISSINQKLSSEAYRTDSKLVSKNNQQKTVSNAIQDHTEHKTGKWVALTFDDGPSPVYTPKVLAILHKFNIKATFCIIGEEAKRFPYLVKDIVSSGNKLCDHTMTHDERLPSKSDKVIKEEILGDKHVLEQIVPNTPIDYYRAPGGAWSPRVREQAASWGLEPLGWSVDTRDWARPGVASILNAVKTELRPGGVILMHDGGGNRDQSISALKQIIPNLQKQGYKFDFPG